MASNRCLMRISDIAVPLPGWETSACSLQSPLGMWPVCNRYPETCVEGLSGAQHPQSKNCSFVSNSATPWNSPGQNTGVGSLSLLQGIFPIQGSNPGPPHCRQILYQLSHKGSPRVLEWVAYPFSSRSPQPRNRPGSPALQVDS